MTLQHIALALMAASCVGQVQAAMFNGATTSSGTTVTNYSAGSALSVDVDLASMADVALSFTVDADDMLNGTLSFNALVRDMTGLGVPSYGVVLDGIGFAQPYGSISTDGFAAVTASDAQPAFAWAAFTPAVTSELYVGNPLARANDTDWTFSLQGLQAGSNFTVTLTSAVPEPSSYALLLAGLCAVGAVARHRGMQRK